MNLENVYPYLMPGLISPEFDTVSIPIGHDVYVVVFEDTESDVGIVHSMITPYTVEITGLDAPQIHQRAMHNLERFAESDDLAIKMLGRPGEEVNFLLFHGHPRASACLLLPNLYELAQDLLESDELCACIPQRETMVIFPKRDRTYRESLVAKLKEIEGDARRPITFELFELTPDGVVPFVEP
ncbi:MAG: hypothetical protein HY774_15815 [Acidobacteria bacterium]|nr:hypothetical protein [Acidobacteriota bacterium]